MTIGLPGLLLHVLQRYSINAVLSEGSPEEGGQILVDEDITISYYYDNEYPVISVYSKSESKEMGSFKARSRIMRIEDVEFYFLVSEADEAKQNVTYSLPTKTYNISIPVSGGSPKQTLFTLTMTGLAVMFLGTCILNKKGEDRARRDEYLAFTSDYGLPGAAPAAPTTHRDTHSSAIHVGTQMPASQDEQTHGNARSEASSISSRSGSPAVTPDLGPQQPTSFPPELPAGTQSIGEHWQRSLFPYHKQEYAYRYVECIGEKLSILLSRLEKVLLGSEHHTIIVYQPFVKPRDMSQTVKSDIDAVCQDALLTDTMRKTKTTHAVLNGLVNDGAVVTCSDFFHQLRQSGCFTHLQIIHSESQISEEVKRLSTIPGSESMNAAQLYENVMVILQKYPQAYFVRNYNTLLRQQDRSPGGFDVMNVISMASLISLTPPPDVWMLAESLEGNVTIVY